VLWGLIVWAQSIVSMSSGDEGGRPGADAFRRTRLYGWLVHLRVLQHHGGPPL